MKRIKLYNFSVLPDRELRACLEHAAKEAGCDGPVVVKVTRGGRSSHGLAKRCAFVYKWFLSRRAIVGRGAGELRRGTVATNGGYAVISPCAQLLKCGAPWNDPLVIAKDTYKLALHELAHVADFQQHKPFGQYNRHWANRPHEQRAITAATFGMLKKDAERDERILALAIAIEGKGKVNP